MPYDNRLTQEEVSTVRAALQTEIDSLGRRLRAATTVNDLESLASACTQLRATIELRILTPLYDARLGGPT